MNIGDPSLRFCTDLQFQFVHDLSLTFSWKFIVVFFKIINLLMSEDAENVIQ